jgi:hypothetical protein
MERPSTTDKVSFAAVMSRADYGKLTGAQKVWIKLFLGTGDAVRATKIAFPRTSVKTLPSRVCHIKNHPAIRRILSAAYGEPEPDVLAETLLHAIRKSLRRDGGLSPDTTAAIKFYERQLSKKLKAVTRAQ